DGQQSDRRRKRLSSVRKRKRRRGSPGKQRKRCSRSRNAAELRNRRKRRKHEQEVGANERKDPRQKDSDRLSRSNAERVFGPPERTRAGETQSGLAEVDMQQLEQADRQKKRQCERPGDAASLQKIERGDGRHDTGGQRERSEDRSRGERANPRQHVIEPRTVRAERPDKIRDADRCHQQDGKRGKRIAAPQNAQRRNATMQTQLPGSTVATPGKHAVPIP